MTTAARTVIQATQLMVQYRDKTVLNHVSVEVQAGQWIYLVGRTGCGKSTLLKCLYGDIFPDKGNVWFDGKALADYLPDNLHLLRRKMGIVFQDFMLLPNKTVQENVMFALRATGWRERDAMQRCSEVLLTTGMTSKQLHYPHQLSGGEQQRVAIARALINQPLILIADEPTGNLDPVSADEVMQVLRTINRSGTAILMATHNYDLLRRYPGQLLRLADGMLTHFSTADGFLKAVFA